MSTFYDDEEMKRHTDRFHLELKRAREENARKEQARIEWERSTDPQKPDAKNFNLINGGPPMTEDAMVKAAKERADHGLLEERKLKAAGIIDDQAGRKELDEARERNRIEVEKRMKVAKDQRDQQARKQSQKR